MSKLKKIFIFLGDVIILYLSLGLTLIIRYQGQDFIRKFQVHFWPFTVIFLIWVLILYLFNLYRYKKGKKDEILKNVFLATLVSEFLSITSFYLLPQFFELTPKTNLAIFGLLFIVFKYSWQRLIICHIFPSGAEKVLIIGDSPLIQKCLNNIKDKPQIGYKISKWIKDVSLINPNSLSKITENNEIHTIVIQNEITKNSKIKKLVYKLLSHEVNIINFWNFYEIIFEKVPLEELEEGWFIENITTHQPFYEKIKRIIDVTISFLALIIFSPFALISILLIKLTSKGKIIYKSKRTGKNNKSFILYKFRTMYNDKNGPLWTKENDSRITPIGKFLRKTHFDELPQLINIFKGDISLIGPRPERIELSEKFNKLPYYDIRHSIKPGLTGWAQINFKPSASMKEALEKLAFDVYYIKNRSIMLDITITIRTIRYFFTANRD